jgi:RNA polymerase sigma-70 factor (ECF subfamily)
MLASLAVAVYNLPVQDVVAGVATPLRSWEIGDAGAATLRSPSPEANWKEVVTRIQLGDQPAMEALYRVFAKGIRYYLRRQLGPQDQDDRVHDTFLIVVEAIQRGEIREPERLMGFVRTVVRRQVATYIDQAVHRRRDEADVDIDLRISDPRHNPERRAVRRQKVEFMKEVLRGLSARDREILTRFYLREEPQESICARMKLSETQFRLLKSRAKSRFGALGQRRLLQQPLPAACAEA